VGIVLDIWITFEALPPGKRAVVGPKTTTTTARFHLSRDG
jgi:hypothetical protein